MNVRKSFGGRLVLYLFVVTLAALLVVPAAALAQETEVVTLGANLDQAQRQQMLDLFGVSADSDVSILEVTNQEEREYLQGLVPDEQIGSRAISSVHVVIQDDGSGIDVETENITFVTEQTYANALVTAGIRDADIFAAAPFAVSGTAALTGVFKAFEEATGEQISEEAKQTATQELVDTAETGQEVGDPAGVADLMTRAKEEVVDRGLDDPAEVRDVVINIANELNIDLSDAQIDRLVDVLIQIENLNIDVDSLQGQLKDFTDSIGLSGEEAQGLWERVQGFFQDIWDAIFG